MSDRGHWLRCARNAWQKLGRMSPEVAMEQYIKLLSDRVPGWMEGKFSVSLLLLIDLSSLISNNSPMENRWLKLIGCHSLTGGH